jgi:hypothetical protein
MVLREVIAFYSENRNTEYPLDRTQFLGPFAEIWKATISFVMSVRPSVRMEQLGPHWKYFREILFEDFRNSVEKIQVLLKSDKNSGYFTWIPIGIYNHTSLSSSWNEKCFRHSWREEKIHFMIDNFFSLESHGVYDITWKNIVESDRPEMTIWPMRIACWITKATGTRSCFLRQQWLREGVSNYIYTYSASLVEC